MKLKKLELFGFKSFADKEEFLFEPGITVIVGPNGCGKSNVMDGIKWILGEQSAKSLRGKEMSDIIFGGSSGRSAVSFAEGSLTMSNEENLLPIEYKEVSITRRLYASGESEYLINKNLCRLKDIRELFMGTGIGVNSYSIIEQGKVEALLQANAQQRREVFEEAAGISKYKARKKEALLKLDKVQQNLLRLADIVNEVDKQLRSIKIQATKARKYKEYSTRLKELRIRLSYKNFCELKEKRASLLTEIDDLLKNGDSFLETVNTKEEMVIEFEEKLSVIDQKITEIRTGIINFEAQIRNIKDKISFNNEKLIDLDIQESKYKDESAELNRQIEENDATLIKVKNELVQIDEDARTESDQLAIKSVELEQINLETDMFTEKLEEKKSGIMDAFHNQSRIQNEIGNQTTLVDTLKNQKNRIEGQQIEIATQLELSIENKQCLFNRHEEHVNEAQELENKQSNTRTTVADLHSEINNYNNNISQLGNNRSSKQARLEVLEDYETRSEGVDVGAKAVLEESLTGNNNVSAVCGLVADIIKVDLDLARAIETALGDLVQSVVTKTHDDTLKAIDFLRDTKVGHATFLPMDKVKLFNSNGIEELVDDQMTSESHNDRMSAEQHTNRMTTELHDDLTTAEPHDNRLTAEPQFNMEEMDFSGDRELTSQLYGTGNVSGTDNVSDERELASQLYGTGNVMVNEAVEIKTEHSYSATSEGIVGKASKLIKYADEFTSVVNYMLGRTLIVEDFDKAISLISSIYKGNGHGTWLNNEYGEINRIITLDGSIIEKHGIIRGGVFREKPGLISRKSEMESIKRDIVEIDLKIKQLNEEKDLRTEQLASAEQNLTQTTKGLENLNIVLLNNRNEQKHEDNKIVQLNEEKNVLVSELKEIEINIENIEIRNRDFHVQLNTLNEQRKQLEEEVETISKDMESKESLRFSLQEDITNVKINIAQKNEKRESTLSLINRLESNSRDYRNRLSSMTLGIEESQNKKQKAANEITEWEQNFTEFGSKKDEAEGMMETLVSDRSYVAEDLSEVKSDLEEYKSKHKNVEDQLHKLQLKENECLVKSKDLEERIAEEYSLSLSKLEQVVLNFGKEVEIEEDEPELNENIEESMEEAETTEAEVTEATQVTENDGEKTEMDDEDDDDEDEDVIEQPPAENKMDYLQELAAVFREKDEDWDTVSQEIDELRSQVSRIGNVNLDAIKEQDELEERTTFLTTQSSDLVTSEKSLKEIIEKLNETSRELFEKIFNDIKINFHVYFRKLFGGGKADIILQPGVDVLDADIDIIIQPPNKEFKAIALFSGGEKVLITVALLFAIFKSKPSPFCLMDEVDAALDESNVGRFTMVLKEFAADSQFVIISHNKKTMSVADAIYGVTMEEPGVSKKVSVKFDQFDEFSEN